MSLHNNIPDPDDMNEQRALWAEVALRELAFDVSGPQALADANNRDHIATESDQERRISAAMLKSITGGERLRAARMYEQDRAFDVTFKIWLSTNHEPCITDTSEGMWRRVHRVNFNVIIPPERRDPQFVPKLIGEASGILNWCLEGLRQYRAGGLQVPDAISKATAEYRTSFYGICVFAGYAGSVWQLSNNLRACAPLRTLRWRDT